MVEVRYTVNYKINGWAFLYSEDITIKQEHQRPDYEKAEMVFNNMFEEANEESQDTYELLCIDCKVGNRWESKIYDDEYLCEEV